MFVILLVITTLNIALTDNVVTENNNNILRVV